MDFPGLRDDLAADNPDGAQSAQNVSFGVDGELRVRSGLADRQALGGPLVADLLDAHAGQHVVVRDSSGNIKTSKLTGSVTTVLSGLNTDNVGSVARVNGRLLFANGFDAVKVVDSATASGYSAGIEEASWDASSLSSGGSGNLTAGDHLIRFRHYNSKTRYYGDPSAAITVTAAGDDKLQLTWGTDLTQSADAKVDQVVVEATLAGGSTYYVASYLDNAASGAVDAFNLSDATLQLQEVLDADSDGFGNDEPPVMDIIAEHRGRLFGMMAGSFSRTLNVSSGSTAVSGVDLSTNWGDFIADIGGVQYRLASVDSSTSATLSVAYSGTTNTGVTTTIYSRQRDLLYWSTSGRPESFRPLKKARRVFNNQTDVPTGLASAHDLLVIFGQRTMRTLLFTDDPAGGQLANSMTSMGLSNQRCLVEAEGRLYGFGRAGIWHMRGISPVHISKPIDATIRGDIDWAQSDDFHGVYDPIARVIYWFYVQSDDTDPKRAAVLDVDSGKWSIAQFRQAIVGSSTVSTDSGEVYAALSDENGYTWYLQEGVFDGVPSSADAILTLNGAQSGTSISVNETLTADDYIGCIAYSPDNDEESLVTDNDTSSLTLDTALSNIADNGELWMGSIVTIWKTNWQALAGKDGKSCPEGVSISLVPSSATGKLEVRIFRNFSSTAESATVKSGDQAPAGVTLTNGSAVRKVDLDGGGGEGQACVPASATTGRHWSFELKHHRPDGTLKVQEAAFRMRRSDAGEVVLE